MGKIVKIVAGIIIVFLLILGAQYLMRQQTSPSTEGSTENVPKETAKQTGSSKTGTKAVGTANTFGGIFSQAGSHECKYAGVDGNRQHNDVIYIADGKMRAEFRTTGEVADLMVFDGTYLYSWQEGKTTGTKTRLSSVADLPRVIPQDLTSGAVFGTSVKNVSWDCHQWIKDSKLLVAPTYVKF